jgi:DNA polymerase-3 subunit alpha
MAYLQLEDQSGLCPVICFPDSYDLYREHLAVDKVVFIRGKINNRKEDAAEIIVDDVIPVEVAIEKLPKRILLEIDGDKESEIEKMKELFSDHRGDCQVVFEIKKDGYQIFVEIAEKNYLKPSEDLLRNLEEILGKNSVLMSAS